MQSKEASTAPWNGGGRNAAAHSRAASGRQNPMDWNIGRNLEHFWKSHVRAKKLDVQETDFSFSKFNRS